VEPQAEARRVTGAAVAAAESVAAGVVKRGRNLQRRVVLRPSSPFVVFSRWKPMEKSCKAHSRGTYSGGTKIEIFAGHERVYTSAGWHIWRETANAPPPCSAAVAEPGVFKNSGLTTSAADTAGQETAPGNSSLHRARLLAGARVAPPAPTSLPSCTPTDARAEAAPRASDHPQRLMTAATRLLLAVAAHQRSPSVVLRGLVTTAMAAGDKRLARGAPAPGPQSSVPTPASSPLAIAIPPPPVVPNMMMPGLPHVTGPYIVGTTDIEWAEPQLAPLVIEGKV